MFARRDAVLYYDRSRGLVIPNGVAKKNFDQFCKGFDAVAGTQHHLRYPTDPAGVLRLVERFIQTRVAEGKGVAFVLDYAEQIAPAGEAGQLGDSDRSCLTTLRRWSRDANFLRGDVTVVLLPEQLAELNAHLVSNPFTDLVQLELPDRDARLRFIEAETAGRAFSDICELGAEAVAELTCGLSLTHVRQILAESLRLGRRITMASLMSRKKELIEAECHGLIEFVTSPYTLDMVAGCTEAKEQLRTAARQLRGGFLDVLPMGWLVCGPVGTGKTFLATCFSGEVGIPCVKILNIRSQWVGQTEANLQKLLTVFKALGPLAVIIDEADAFFGNRDASGDSGTSGRVFSALASFMSDTRHRGHILWFLLTCRPDLLPVDLKRQGRAEEHVALFPPSTKAEREEFYAVLIKKNRIKTAATPADIDVLYEKCGAPRLSGADFEALLIRAKSVAAADNRREVTGADFEAAFADFIPPVYAEEVEYQTLVAVMECTSRKLIPEPYRSMPRDAVIRRVKELRVVIEG
jgi:AAA+ superfamily predicted ATPase